MRTHQDRLSDGPSQAGADAARTPGRRTLTGALQRKPARGPAESASPSQGGVPHRAHMEAAFGADFSGVTVGLGETKAMDAIGAEAATQGERISFASATPSPELVAHELAHVVQQRSGRVAGEGVDPDPQLEREADDVGARAARGEQVAGEAPAGTGQAGGAVQRKKKNVLKVIDWSLATGGKKISSVNNANCVYKVDFGNKGSVVAKVYNAGGPAKEVLAARLVSELELPGIDAPNMRELTGEEKDECYQALVNIDPKVPPKLSVAVMDVMEGKDFGGTDQVDPDTDEGSERLENTGSLLAFNHMIRGRDRFADPWDKTNRGNNSNLRYEKGEGTQVQAIDNTLPEGDSYALGDEGPEALVEAQAKRIGPYIDDLILNQDSELAKTLCVQLGLDPGDGEALRLIQRGFMGGAQAIADAEVDFVALVVGVNGRSPLLTTMSSGQPAYAKYLAGMQRFFKEKMAFAQSINAAKGNGDQLRADAIELLRDANQIAIGRPARNVDLVDAHASSKDGEHGKWPAALKTLHTGKDAIGRKTTPEKLGVILADVGPAFEATSDPHASDAVLGDFCRVVAKTIQRALKQGLAQKSEEQPEKESKESKEEISLSMN